MLLALLLALAPPTATACTTLVAGRLATADGSVMASHSNDGAANSGGRIQRVRAADWPPGSNRTVSGGAIPQVPHTFAYHTEGYAIQNEHQVALGESTCAAVFAGDPQRGILTVIDLGMIALERANSSRAAVELMGALAEQYGYNDAGESLMVIDPREAFIFHVLPDDTGGSAVWVAERVPDDGVGAVANAFTVRTVDFEDSRSFLASSNMRAVAARATNWTAGTPLDFTKTFSKGEDSLFYSGRRMWSAYRLLAPERSFSPHYSDFNADAPYPATVRVAHGSINSTLLFRVMRDYYQGTDFDLTSGVAAGPFGSPDRWYAGAAEAAIPDGGWERAIGLYRTLVSFIVIARDWLPDEIGGVTWFGPHAAHTGVYTPFPCGMDAIPPAYTWEAAGTGPEWAAYDRTKALWAHRAVFNLAQLRFSHAIEEIRATGDSLEANSFALQGRWDARLAHVSAVSEGEKAALSAEYTRNANDTVAAWWELSERLLAHFGEGYCNAGKPLCASRELGYPAWWLHAADFAGGKQPHPPPSAPSAAAGGSGSVKACVGRCKKVESGGYYETGCVDACLDAPQRLKSDDAARPAGSGTVFNVLEHGAKGDGISNDTAAIRASLAAAAKAGGGVVLLPAPHTFLSGSLHMQSHTIFRVEAGAMLLGSTIYTDYPHELIPGKIVILSRFACCPSR